MRRAPPNLAARAIPVAMLCALATWPAPVRAGRDTRSTLLRRPAPPAAVQADSARIFATKLSSRDEITFRDLNLMSMTVSNYGFIGNNFTSRTPSMEYPVGSGHDHLVRGGLWIGAIDVDDDGVFAGVTTGALDGIAGGDAQGATEFSPLGTGIEVRSTLTNHQRYSPDAVSERDLISHFDDLIIKRAASNDEDHRPLGVTVRQENYSWSFANYRHMVFYHWVIKNTGSPLRNAYLGVYGELTSVPKNTYSTFPPNSLGPLFAKKLVSWVDSLNMFVERYCEAPPIPQNCLSSKAPELAALKILGVRPGSIRIPGDKRVNMHCWDFAPGDNSRDEDLERYGVMADTNKTVLSPLPPDLAPQSGDPCELISAGPFFQVNPGDSIEVDFVYLGALDEADLVRRAQTAQRAYDLNYIVPVPPPSPRFRAIARAGAIDYYWDDSPESYLDPTSPLPRDFEGYRVYAGEDREDVRLIAQVDLATAPHDTTGFNTGLDSLRLSPPAIIDGVTYHYKYTLANLRDGFKYFTAVTAYDLGNQEIESLESGIGQNESMVVPAPRVGERAGGVAVFPNPYRVEAEWDAGQNVRDHYLWFANLPPRCKLRIYTLAGDLVYETDFNGGTYDGSNARGVYNPANDLPGTFSGATFGWDLITRRGQAAATGLYMWSVEDLANGKTQVGKVLLVKSDREGVR